ncbi:MAG TPA: hypothetical protein VM165_03520, partial [Planctomycetaceae bacterium]|nr:hypothetical protein [Planctomycetaceae bacterium]
MAMKAGWFQQAKSVFGRPEPVAQSFSVPCDCGATLLGERAESPQKPLCPACGRPVFVLPACLYPIPESIRRSWSGVEDEVLPEAPPKKKSGKKSASPSEPTSRPAKSKALKPPPVPWSQRQQALTTAARAQLTPLRLIAMAVCLTVTLMGYVLYRQARWSHAQSTVQASIDAGTEALSQRDFPKAAQALDEAAAALTILRRRDDAAQTIQRLARETMVCDGLSADSLPQMLTELFEQREPAELSARFARRCAGRWILFDAPLYLATEEKKSVLFDLPLLVGKELIEVRLDGRPWPSLLSGSTA